MATNADSAFFLVRIDASIPTRRVSRLPFLPFPPILWIVRVVPDPTRRLFGDYGMGMGHNPMSGLGGGMFGGYGM